MACVRNKLQTCGKWLSGSENLQPIWDFGLKDIIGAGCRTNQGMPLSCAVLVTEDLLATALT